MQGTCPGGRKQSGWGLPSPAIALGHPWLMHPGCSADPRLSVPGQAWISGSCCLHGSGRQPRRRRAEDMALLQDELQRFASRLAALPDPSARSAASAGSRLGTGTGRGCTHPRSISFSIVPTAEGTCLKVEPEIARLCAASGLAGLQGLAGGQAPTAAVGTFQPAPAGVDDGETEPFWGRPSPGSVVWLSQPPAAGARREQAPCSSPGRCWC